MELFWLCRTGQSKDHNFQGLDSNSQTIRKLESALVVLLRMKLQWTSSLRLMNRIPNRQNQVGLNEQKADLSCVATALPSPD